MGWIKVRVKGELTKTIQDGFAHVRFDGFVESPGVEKFDFNPSDHRPGFKEDLTRIGAWITDNTIAAPFDIYIEGQRKVLLNDRTPIGIRVPLATVSSARIPGSRATVASGEETSALDVFENSVVRPRGQTYELDLRTELDRTERSGRVLHGQRAGLDSGEAMVPSGNEPVSYLRATGRASRDRRREKDLRDSQGNHLGLSTLLTRVDAK